MIYEKKGVKTPSWIFQTNGYGITGILSKHQVCNRNIGFSIAKFKFLIKFVVIRQTLE